MSAVGCTNSRPGCPGLERTLDEQLRRELRMRASPNYHSKSVEVIEGTQCQLKSRANEGAERRGVPDQIGTSRQASTNVRGDRQY